MRSSSVEVDDMLRDIFDIPAQVAEPGGKPPDYSFWLPAPATTTGVRRLGTLFSGCEPVLRARSVERLVRALHSQLQDHQRATRDDIVAVEALAVVDPATRKAALLPRYARYRYGGLPQVLERRGLRVVDGMLCSLCPRTGALLIEPGLTVDDHQRRRMLALSLTSVADEPVPDGPYEVSAWFRHADTTSRSSLLVQTLRRSLRNGAVIGTTTAMQAVARTLRGAEIVPLSAPPRDAVALARAVSARLDRPEQH